MSGTGLLLLGGFFAATQDPRDEPKPGILPVQQALTALPLAGARDMSGEGRAFVETEVLRDTFYVQEPIRLRLRFGLERPFLDKDMIQLFVQPLDVPVQMQAPWLVQQPGVLVRAGPVADVPAAGAERRLSFALDESRAEGVRVENRTVGASTFTVLEIEATWLPTVAGDLVIPAPLLRFAYATRFEEDTLNGRIPADRRDAYVRGKPITLHIVPWPEAGRPSGFGGAVGRFRVQADANPRDLQTGESLKLALRVEGEGNFELFQAPSLEGIAGFRVLGTVDEIEATRRTITYDLQPVDERVTSIPRITLPYFDPTPPGAYRIAQTLPVAIEVRAPGSARRGADDGLRVDPGGNLVLLIIAGLLVVVLLFVILRLWRRRPQSEPAGHPRVHAAAAAFRERAAKPGHDVADMFLEFLSTLLGCPVPAVIGPELPARLAAAGVPADLAVRTAQTLDRVMAGKYGGRAPPDSLQRAREMVDTLEAVLSGNMVPGAPPA